MQQFRNEPQLKTKTKKLNGFSIFYGILQRWRQWCARHSIIERFCGVGSIVEWWWLHIWWQQARGWGRPTKNNTLRHSGVLDWNYFQENCWYKILSVLRRLKIFRDRIGTFINGKFITLGEIISVEKNGEWFFIRKNIRSGLGNYWTD